MPRNPLRDALTARIANRLGRLLPATWHLRSQSALALREGVPEPDVAVVRGDELDDTSRHPGPADLALVVEVSWSSIALDRGQKARIDARASIPTYWIVDIAGHSIEALTDPSGDIESPGGPT